MGMLIRQGNQSMDRSMYAIFMNVSDDETLGLISHGSVYERVMFFINADGT